VPYIPWIVLLIAGLLLLVLPETFVKLDELISSWFKTEKNGRFGVRVIGAVIVIGSLEMIVYYLWYLYEFTFW